VIFLQFYSLKYSISCISINLAFSPWEKLYQVKVKDKEYRGVGKFCYFVRRFSKKRNGSSPRSIVPTSQTFRSTQKEHISSKKTLYSLSQGNTWHPIYKTSYRKFEHWRSLYVDLPLCTIAFRKNDLLFNTWIIKFTSTLPLFHWGHILFSTEYDCH